MHVHPHVHLHYVMDTNVHDDMICDNEYDIVRVIHVHLSVSHTPCNAQSQIAHLHFKSRDSPQASQTAAGPQARKDPVGNPNRAQISQFELFELILLLKYDKQLPVEQFEATVSQSTVPSPPLKSGLFMYCLVSCCFCIH